MFDNDTGDDTFCGEGTSGSEINYLSMRDVTQFYNMLSGILSHWHCIVCGQLCW